MDVRGDFLGPSRLKNEYTSIHGKVWYMYQSQDLLRNSKRQLFSFMCVCVFHLLYPFPAGDNLDYLRPSD